MNNLKKSALSLAIMSSLALVGCGGGGGSSESEVADGGSSTQLTQSVSGTAVKGLMQNATVIAYELENNGERKAEVGTTETDDKGTYSIDLTDTYAGGLIEIEVTRNSNTLMVCDATACGTVEKGEKWTPPEGFRLNAIASAPAEDGKVSASVTAWSTMATKRAKKLAEQAPAQGGRSFSDAVRQASAEVNQVAGFDVARTTARGVNDLQNASAPEAQSAVMNAVVAEIVFGSGDGDVAAKLEQFANDLEDGIIGNNENSVPVADLAARTREVIDATPNLDSVAKDSLNNQASEYDSAEDGFEPTYDEDLDIGEDSTPDAKITAFREFVSQARTWATSIENLDSDALSAAIQVDADTIQAALGDGTLSSLKMSLEIIGQTLETIVIDPATIRAAVKDGGSVPFDVMDGEVKVGTATLAFTNENDLLVASIVGELTGEAATNYLPFVMQLDTNVPVGALNLEAGTIGSLMESTTMVITGQVSDGNGFDLVQLNSVEAKLNLSSKVDEVVAGEGVVDSQLNSAFVGASLTGDVEFRAATGERFQGTIETLVTRLKENRIVVLNDAPLSIKRLRVAGGFTAADGSTFNTSATLNINNASTVDTFSLLEYSGAERDVWAPVETSAIQPLLDTLPANVVLPNGSIDVWAAGDDAYQGYAYISGYDANGVMKGSEVTIQSAEVPKLTSAVVGVVTDLLPDELTLVYDDGTGNFVEFPLVVKTAFSSGQLGARARFVEDGTGGLGVEIAVYPTTESLLPAGAPAPTVEDAVWAFLPMDPDLPAGTEGGIRYVNGQEQFGLSIPADTATIEAARTALELNTSLIEDATTVSFAADSQAGIGGVVFMRPADLQYYENCLAAPQSQLAALGQSFDPTFGNADYACADATLSGFWQNNELVPDTLDITVGIAKDALAARYGALAADLSINGFNLGIYEGRGDLNIWAEFPNLETADNFVDASFTVSSALDIPELPAARVTATATRNSLLGGKVLANVKWDGGQYSLEVASDNLEEPTSINARFFNPQGYELKVNVALDQNGDVTGVNGDAFINGEDIGDVTDRNGAPVITYPNGEETMFETLF